LTYVWHVRTVWSW